MNVVILYKDHMKRIHLFEFEDQKWFPSFLRNYVTDFLQFLSNRAKVYEPVVDDIVRTLSSNGINRIVDMGSGSGGGLIWLGQTLVRERSDLKILLTDLYPNKVAFDHIVRNQPFFEYNPEPVNATRVPVHLEGMRTMFLSFHHFRSRDAVSILQNAVDARQPIAIFEGQDRSLLSIIAMLLSPLSVLLTTPFIKPFRWGRLVFTYLIPVVPLVVLWDGLISSFRTYSVAEMKELVKQVRDNEQYDWQFSKKKGKAGFVISTIGVPKK